MRALHFEPKWVVVIVFFLAGTFIGGLALFIWLFNGSQVFGLQKIHPSKSPYQFVNPLLAVDTIEKKEFLENKDLESKVQIIINDSKSKDLVRDVAVYFRDLEAGRWFGINHDNKFSPGTILKVPIMIAYFKEAETKPDLLKKQLQYNAKPPKSDSSFQNGKWYTIDELIDGMIDEDDDPAAAILFDNIDKNALDDVYSDLGVDFHEDKLNDDYISLKLYSLFFRILYNATYLSRPMSEKALSILNQTSMENGVAAGLPNDISIAHKYRTRAYQKNGFSGSESHDCGIIYYPDHPYVLCMMGIGKNANDTNLMFETITRQVYREMNRSYNLRKK